MPLLAGAIPPSRVTAGDILERDLNGDIVVETWGKSYLGRFIDAEIYRRWPEANAGVHSHPPSVIASGVTKQTLRRIFHMTAFLCDAVIAPERIEQLFQESVCFQLRLCRTQIGYRCLDATPSNSRQGEHLLRVES